MKVPMPAGRTLLALALLILSGVAFSGCITPSVPIPPPEPEKMTFAYDAAAGNASFTFDPDPSYAFAVVYVFNRDQGIGVIETARGDGSVGPTRPFAAAIDDSIVISFELASQLSSTCVKLRDGRSSSALECEF
jgi:hypothetical protein